MIMIQLHLGDCLPILKTLPSGSVDSVILDPPYGRTKLHWDRPLPRPRRGWKLIHRLAAFMILSPDTLHPLSLLTLRKNGTHRMIINLCVRNNRICAFS